MVAAVAAEAAGPTAGAAQQSPPDWRWLIAVTSRSASSRPVIAHFSLPYTERAQHSLNYVSVVLHVYTFGLLISGLQSLVHEDVRLVAALQIAAACVSGTLLVRREI